jgi:hypothetical protein
MQGAGLGIVLCKPLVASRRRRRRRQGPFGDRRQELVFIGIGMDQVEPAPSGETFDGVRPKVSPYPPV